MRHLVPWMFLALSSPALAQSPPAAETPPESPLVMPQELPQELPAEQPAAQAARPTARAEEGTTIVGDRESPIGLFITPWRNAGAEEDIDRPARLLQEQLLPVDEAVFVRQIEYYEALSGALKQKNAVTPPVNLAPQAP